MSMYRQKIQNGDTTMIQCKCPMNKASQYLSKLQIVPCSESLVEILFEGKVLKSTFGIGYKVPSKYAPLLLAEWYAHPKIQPIVKTNNKRQKQCLALFYFSKTSKNWKKVLNRLSTISVLVIQSVTGKQMICPWPNCSMRNGCQCTIGWKKED